MRPAPLGVSCLQHVDPLTSELARDACPSRLQADGDPSDYPGEDGYRDSDPDPDASELYEDDDAA